MRNINTYISEKFFDNIGANDISNWLKAVEKSILKHDRMGIRMGVAIYEFNHKDLSITFSEGEDKYKIDIAKYWMTADDNEIILSDVDPTDVYALQIDWIDKTSHTAYINFLGEMNSHVYEFYNIPRI